MIKTFRGSLASASEQKIRLSTKNGKIGYRIKKFQIMESAPGTTATELIMKIYKVTQPSINALVDFADGNLLGVCYYESGNIRSEQATQTAIFEQEIFNQDIFVTSVENVGSGAGNYYLELEVINLSDNAATVSTLRDIRLNPQVGG